ncbi:hypothetical protein BGX38DRAFT_1194859 [Terfezia claveryi]|nr:hypothetical protein BGX38DRAFT_1194859 [Terfezia claveryi]
MHQTMPMNVKKAPPGRSAKRLQRPYPKADITIEDQQREQKKLLNAGKAFSGYNRLNLDIIAISYEHKCFSEAKRQEDYLSKIRKKLIEWKYVPETGEEVNTAGPLQLPPQPPGQPQKQSQSPKPARSHHHRRHLSGPAHHSIYETTRNHNGGSPGAPQRPALASPNGPTSPMKNGFARTGQSPSAQVQGTSAFQPPFPQLRPSQYQAQSEQDERSQFHSRSQRSAHHLGSPYSNGQSPTTESYKVANSPKSQPMSHTATAMSDSSNGSSQDTFVNLFDPKFLKNLNLNDPEQRTVWVNSVWDYFCSGGQWNGHAVNCSNAGSQSNSPVPLYTSLYGSNNIDEDIGMQGMQQGNGVSGDVNMIGSFGNFNDRPVNGYGRRQSEDLARVTSYSRHHSDHMNGNSQWMTSELLHMSMDIGMGNMNNMDGIMTGDSMNSGISNRNMEKWMVQ